MKKTLAILITLMLIFIFSIYAYIMSVKTEKKQLLEYNAEYESYLNKEIYGTEVASLINKVVNLNEKNEVEKDENNYYIDNGQNSIKINLKMITIEKTYPMEEFYNNDITAFVQNFNLIKFKCTNIEYHNKTGKVSKMTFEQLEY